MSEPTRQWAAHKIVDWSIMEPPQMWEKFSGSHHMPLCCRDICQGYASGTREPWKMQKFCEKYKSSLLLFSKIYWQRRLIVQSARIHKICRYVIYILAKLIKQADRFYIVWVSEVQLNYLTSQENLKIKCRDKERTNPNCIFMYDEKFHFLEIIAWVCGWHCNPSCRRKEFVDFLIKNINIFNVYMRMRKFLRR